MELLNVLCHMPLRFVGSKTTVRIVNHSWQDFRETRDEIVLSHLRGCESLTIDAPSTRVQCPKLKYAIIFYSSSNQ